MRMFIASPVHITPEIESTVNSLSNIQNLKLTGINNFHITYLFLGEINVNEANHIIGQLKQISSNKISARVSGIMAFPNISHPRVIVIVAESPCLLNLHDSVLRLLPEYKNIGRKFLPHITIARVKNGTTLPDISRLSTTLSTTHGRVSIKEMCLFKSVLTYEGPLYERIYCREFT